MAGVRNIHIRQGDTFTHFVDINFSLGIPESIEDYEFESQVREAGYDPLSPTSSGPPLAVFNISSPEVSGNRAKVACVLSHEQTSDIPPGKHWYDIQMLEKDGEVEGRLVTLLYGTIVVIPEISP